MKTTDGGASNRFFSHFPGKRIHDPLSLRRGVSCASRPLPLTSWLWASLVLQLVFIATVVWLEFKK